MPPEYDGISRLMYYAVEGTPAVIHQEATPEILYDPLKEPRIGVPPPSQKPIPLLDAETAALAECPAEYAFNGVDLGPVPIDPSSAVASGSSGIASSSATHPEPSSSTPTAPPTPGQVATPVPSYVRVSPPLTPEQKERRDLRRRLGSREYNKRVRATLPPSEPRPQPHVEPAVPPTVRAQIQRAATIIVVVGAIIWGAMSCHGASGGSGSGGNGGGNGYRVVCRDGWVSYSGGIQGACSHHGGVAP